MSPFMILDKNIASYTVFNKSGLTEALAKISSNSRGIVFVVDESGSLVGILTDGDFRKWLIAQTSKSSVVDLSTEVENAMNINFVFARVDDPPVKIESLLDEVIKFVPVLDPRNRIVSIARKRDKKINLGGVEISANTNSYLINSPTFVIAEVGNNHNGDLELGKRLVKESIEAGAAFRSIHERHGGVEIHEVRRQREDWQRDATRDLATGRTGNAISAYDRHGLVHSAETREQARAAAEAVFVDIEAPLDADGWMARARFTNSLGSVTTDPVTLHVVP